MNWKAWTPLAIAIVLGLLAARLSMEVVGSGGTVEQQSANFVPMVVAARDMEPGTQLTPIDLAMGKADHEMVPVGAFNDVNAASNRVLKVAVVRGQPILPTVLAEEGAGYGVAATLPEGMRMITLEINDVTGVAGFITPQSKVDVVTTIQTDGKPTAKTLLESITVLACGSRTTNNPQGGPPEPVRTVTLLVKPDQAEKLDLAMTTSRIRLLLRNGRDKTRSDTNGVTLADLRGDADDASDPFAATASVTSGSTTQPSATPAPMQAKSGWTVEIIKAGQQSTQTFELPPAPRPTAPAKQQQPDIAITDSNPGEIE